MTGKKIDMNDRFFSKVKKTDSCWIWTASKHGHGKNNYGRFGKRKAHIVSWEIANGPIPSGLCVLHRCDNPPCVNPDHLFLGTRSDNAIDMYRKGRGPNNRGHNNGRAKLTPELVAEIRERFSAKPVPLPELAKEYGVTAPTIQKNNSNENLEVRMSNATQIFYGKEFKFDEKEHMYTWDGQPVPGVTTILKCINKPALMPWAVKMTRDYWLEALKKGRTDHDKIHKESWNAHKNFSKAAAEIGSNVHAYAEAALKGLPLPELLTDQAKLGAEAFHKWFDAHKIKLLASERFVLSQEHYYAGTCDLIAEIDGEYCVGDFKTSSGIYPEMRLQTAAYQNAIQEEKGFQVQARWIIRFDKKTGEFEAKRFTDFDLDFTGFKSALALHRALQSIEKGA